MAEDRNLERIGPARRVHILVGDETGGGHLWPGAPGKTPFPRRWSGDRVLRSILSVVDDPASRREAGRGRRVIVTGSRDGVRIRVILDADGRVVSGYPLGERPGRD